jgi:hypothetical protein
MTDSFEASPIIMYHKKVAPNWNIVLIIVFDFIFFCLAIFTKGTDNKLTLLFFSALLYLAISAILIKRTITTSIVEQRLNVLLIR